MSRFNQANTIPKTVSKNGNVQFQKSLKQQAYDLVVNSLYGRDTFYESTSDKAARLHKIVAELVANGEQVFLANLMMFARNEMHIRNMPVLGTMLLIGELYGQKKSFSNTRNLVSEVVQRVDQITDMLALMSTKTKMPMALKRGLSDAFNKFDEYQFAKYNRPGKVSLKDALRIIHPVPRNQAMSDLFRKVMEGTLATPDTWEVVLSKEGNTKVVWEGLIDRKVLGFQATLKNLRNMLNANISFDHKKKVAKYITTNALISKSLPFEFLAAMKSIEAMDLTFNTALIEAMDLTVQNVPILGNKVLVMLDTSGSMGFDQARAAETACFLTAVLAKSCAGKAERFDVVNFASIAKFESVNAAESVYSTYRRLRSAVAGGSTRFEAAIDLVNGTHKEYDTVFCLTDNEVNTFFHSYGVGNFQKNAERYVINCAASKSTPMPEQAGWRHLAGWSTNMFKYIEAMRKGESMIKMLSKPFPYYIAERFEDDINNPCLDIDIDEKGVFVTTKPVVSPTKIIRDTTEGIHPTIYSGVFGYY